MYKRLDNDLFDNNLAGLKIMTFNFTDGNYLTSE